jgi:predicted flavoprotein YhiN
MGGGSWKVTGSDGSWLDLFEKENVPIVPFQSSNCAYRVNWPEDFMQVFEGSPLKNIAISCLNKRQKGEAVITRFGLEGNAIYALSPQIWRN